MPSTSVSAPPPKKERKKKRNVPICSAMKFYSFLYMYLLFVASACSEDGFISVDFAPVLREYQKHHPREAYRIAEDDERPLR